MRAHLLIVLVAACGSSAASSSDPGAGAATHAWRPQHERALAIARKTVDQLSHDPTGPRPDWVLYDPKGDQVVFVGGDAGYQRALAIARSYDVEPRLPARYAGGAVYDPTLGRDPLVNPFADPTPPPPPPFAGVHQLDDDHFTVDRAVIDQVLADPMATARGARIVPSVKNGQPNGFKLYAIRPSSIFAALGLANGDTITAVNGYDLTTPDQALEVYTHLKDATSFDVSITRRGKDLVLHYTIK